MFDWVFAFVHLSLLFGILVYGVYSFVEKNVLRGLFIIFALVGYYFLVLHKPVKKEIRRKREKKSSRPKIADRTPKLP